MVGLLKLSIGGVGPYTFIYGGGQHVATVQVWIVIVAFILATGGVLSARRERGRLLRATAFFGLVAVFITAQLFITKRATGPHHIAMLSPLWLVMLAGLVAISLPAAGQSVATGFWQRAVAGCASLAILLVFVGALRVDMSYLKALHGPVQNANWDPGSYALAKYANNPRSDNTFAWIGALERCCSVLPRGKSKSPICGQHLCNVSLLRKPPGYKASLPIPILSL